MTIFIDMDEVIADAYEAFITNYNTDFNENLTIEDFKGAEAWEIIPQDRKKQMRKYLYTDGFFRSFKPIGNSQDVLEQLCKEHEVYIASAAMEFPNSLKEKSDWLDEYFPFIHWKNRILCGNKFILKGDLLIDDRAYNLKAFNGHSLLFTSPHNIYENSFPRANNWDEAYQFIKSIEK
ncbi:5' nucleotidase, NT5C type [Spongiivirga citrea]|uniref:5'(3')-deoxyribonucleotidase n=1 Tax=Spongiivirga citrea TaxID=1481457 RepID=A0A6M0CJR4_9FLAO|nr:5'(3')-deoxyribonucleotidase [Spongiivirga citrea]NER18176.1 5'(3')-deoxyribonucleotidase [Spongiivirga citrea]